MRFFPKGLAHGFGLKLAIFPVFYFGQYRPGKCVLGYSRRKKRLTRLWKQQVQIVEKFRFFPKGLAHGFGRKLAIFPSFYFRQYRPGKCVLGYSRRKKRLFRLWKQEVKKVEKFRFFAKGLTHGFGPKLAIFPSFYFRQYRPGKCVLGYSRRKKRLSRLWKQEVKKVEKLRFFAKGLAHGFGPKF